METHFPLRDLLLYRIYKGKEILDLEFFDNFSKDLSFLIDNRLIRRSEVSSGDAICPYNYVLTDAGKRYLYR